MISRFDASTSVVEIPGIERRDYALLNRLRVFTWGDLVALDRSAAIEEQERSLPGDAEALDRVRLALGLPALRRGHDLLPIDAWGGVHVHGVPAATLRAVLDEALHGLGLRSRPFGASTRPPAELKVVTTLGPDRIAIVNEGGEWVAVLSERLEVCPVDRTPLLQILRAAEAPAILAYRYVPELFGEPAIRNLLLVRGDEVLRWSRGDDPRPIARALASLVEEPEDPLLEALADEEPFSLADRLGLEHLGFRPYFDDVLAADEEPDVIEFEAG